MNALNKILKSISDSTWGCNKENLKPTYKTISRSHTSSTMRTITGCYYVMEHEGFSHQEMKMIDIPVKQDILFLSEEYYLFCHGEKYAKHANISINSKNQTEAFKNRDDLY